MRLILILVGVGLATGVMAGLMGVGGGIIAVPAMVFLLGLTQHRAHGTSLAIIVLTATASALNYGRYGNVNLQLAAELAVGTVVGSYLGAKLMNRVPAKDLRRAFGAMVIVVGFMMIWTGMSGFLTGVQ